MHSGGCSRCFFTQKLLPLVQRSVPQTPSETVQAPSHLLPPCQQSAMDLGERDGIRRARQLALESSDAAFQHETVLSLHFIRPIKAWHAVITWQISVHFM